MRSLTWSPAVDGQLDERVGSLRRFVHNDGAEDKSQKRRTVVFPIGVSLSRSELRGFSFEKTRSKQFLVEHSNRNSALI